MQINDWRTGNKRLGAPIVSCMQLTVCFAVPLMHAQTIGCDTPIPTLKVQMIRESTARYSAVARVRISEIAVDGVVANEVPEDRTRNGVSSKVIVHQNLSWNPSSLSKQPHTISHFRESQRTSAAVTRSQSIPPR